MNVLNKNYTSKTCITHTDIYPAHKIWDLRLHSEANHSKNGLYYNCHRFSRNKNISTHMYSRHNLKDIQKLFGTNDSVNSRRKFMPRCIVTRVCDIMSLIFLHISFISYTMVCVRLKKIVQ